MFSSFNFSGARHRLRTLEDEIGRGSGGEEREKGEERKFIEEAAIS